MGNDCSAPRFDKNCGCATKCADKCIDNCQYAFDTAGVQQGRTCYLNCTYVCFVSCAGRASVELDALPPQDLAQGECGSGQKCGEASLAGVTDMLTMALQQEAEGGDAVEMLSPSDLQALTSLDQQLKSRASKVAVDELGEGAEDEFRKALKEANLL